MAHSAVLIWSQRWEGAEPKARPGTSADKFVESGVLLRNERRRWRRKSGGVNGVEMSCRMMGHYFWHRSSEPLVFSLGGEPPVAPPPGSSSKRSERDEVDWINRASQSSH